MKLVLIAVLSLLVSAMADSPQGQRLDEDKIKALRQEHKRISELAKWRRETKPNPTVFRMRLLEPTIKGNQGDFERNQRLSRQYLERAQAASRNRQEEAAKKHAEIAKGFHELAETNRTILTSIRDYKNQDLLAAFDDVATIENRIFDLTGRRVPRDWFIPAELAIRLPPEGEELDGRWQDEKPADKE